MTHSNDPRPFKRPVINQINNERFNSLLNCLNFAISYQYHYSTKSSRVLLFKIISQNCSRTEILCIILKFGGCQHLLSKMIYVLLTLFSLLTLASCQSIKYVGSKDVSPIRSPLGGVYWTYMWYQPSVTVSRGCVPFPAVGDYVASAGLRLGGTMNGHCGSSVGQVYARHWNWPEKKVHAIMYAYYFPKDQRYNGCTSTFNCGHRHDWEEVVIWVTWDWKRPFAATMSSHGNYHSDNKHWTGSHYSVKYATCIFGFCNHHFTSAKSGSGYYQHPIANWYQLSAATRYTLENAKWNDEKGDERATPKINNKKFFCKMYEACINAEKRGMFEGIAGANNCEVVWAGKTLAAAECS